MGATAYQKNKTVIISLVKITVNEQIFNSVYVTSPTVNPPNFILPEFSMQNYLLVKDCLKVLNE